ncbi:DUF3872 domain-containing protein [Chryseobacterium sp. G0201]|nr:DUF3872 domain-containing protein [Chryseobacterium sp. G0201]
MKFLIIKKVSFAGRLKFLGSIAGLVMLLFTISSCDKELDVKTDFPFELEVMPVPKSITKGEKVTIRCTIKAEGIYEGTQYFIRYFQFDGTGKLSMGNGKMVTLNPNDLYLVPEEVFRLYYESTSTVTQAFDVWISDTKGHEQKVSFQFNNTQK